MAWLGLLLAAGGRPAEASLGQNLLAERAKLVVVAAKATGQARAQRYRGYSTEEDDWQTACVGTSAAAISCRRSDVAIVFEESARAWPDQPRTSWRYVRTNNPRDPPKAVI